MSTTDHKYFFKMRDGIGGMDVQETGIPRDDRRSSACIGGFIFLASMVVMKPLQPNPSTS